MGTRVLIGIMIGLIMWFLLPRSEAIPGDEIPEAPIELQGTWVTDVEAYQGRYMIIGAKELDLAFGAEAPEAFYPILSIHTQEGTDYTIYVLEYSDAEGQQLLEVHLSRNGDLRLRNPNDVVWRKR